MSSELKIVFFDFDGVLTLEASGTGATGEALASQIGIPYDILKPVFSRYAKKLILEPLGYETIIDPINQELGSDITLEDVLAAAQTTNRNVGMYAVADRLRETGIGTGIITDNNVERIDLLRKAFELDKFNPVIVSATLRAAKWQDTRIFEAALEQAGVEPADALFIDNAPANLTFAAELGMKTYWHNHEVNDIQALRQRLIELGLSV